jgi:dephospho-CoA kinase
MLIAATGLAGAGKTTSLEFLAAIGAGAYFYVGGIVRTEIERRGLELTPENERVVRQALRTERGMAALAERAAPEIQEKLAAGASVLIDAICNSEEATFYRDRFGAELKILAIDTPFDTRAARLAERQPRPMTEEQLRARDHFECEELSIETVIAQADLTLSNHGTQATLQAELRTMASELAG